MHARLPCSTPHYLQPPLSPEEVEVRVKKLVADNLQPALDFWHGLQREAASAEGSAAKGGRKRQSIQTFFKVCKRDQGHVGQVRSGSGCHKSCCWDSCRAWCVDVVLDSALGTLARLVPMALRCWV